MRPVSDMARARGDALATALTPATMRCGVSFDELAVLSTVEATSATIAGDSTRALRSMTHAPHHIASARRRA
ncbi:hypothetical protein [Sorangium sp. So ce233]|uniref:hypothetical protein n=1 Tax=Sorangium sp. So ce233 TaxID=3133290 RepID=UPI003F603CE5